MKLNSFNLSEQSKKKRKRICRGIGSGKGKTGGREVKVKNQELVFQLMDLKEDKCLFI